jgi:hypothetical protein
MTESRRYSPVSAVAPPLENELSFTARQPQRGTPAGIGKRHQRRGGASSPEVLLALCLRDRFANVGFQVSARCLI